MFAVNGLFALVLRYRFGLLTRSGRRLTVRRGAAW